LEENGNLPRQEKARLRQWMRQLLHTADKMALAEADQAICQHLRQLPMLKEAHTIFAFAPLPLEINIWPFLAELAASSQRLCLPRLTGPGHMEAREAGDLNTLTTNDYGIKEPPASSALIPPGEISVALVPGLLFDRSLWRVGQGGGYYDRFLPKTNALRIGLARELQIVDSLPHEPHDMQMQFLLSEKGLLQLREMRRSSR